MTASFEGHVDIVRTLIEAKGQVNTQEKVYTLSMRHISQEYTLYNYIIRNITWC